jgi:thiamine-monophosphate kinase
MARLGEFEIIERFFRRPTDDSVIVGIGDDAAVVAATGPLAIAVDMLVAGTHFPPGLPGHAVGHRALAVNLSDLAAVGARPRWATMALSLPETDPAWLEDFASGFHRLAQRFDIALIGGDTTRGPMTVTVQLIGDAAAATPLRSGGRVGDTVFVSGTLGDSAAGLGRLVAGEGAASADQAALIERFAYPTPRVALGAALAGIAHAVIDISDGLLADLGHILEHSRCGATLELSALPLSQELLASHSIDEARALALNGGDDYELCFCVAAADRERVLAAAEAAETRVTAIGELTADGKLTGRLDGTTRTLEARGFRHF